jgi:Zn ribbon nucleic-acid-binding protein
MTLAELSEKMSNAEFEMWMAEDSLRRDECPNCGVEPRDIGKYVTNEIRCPTCKTTYFRVKSSEGAHEWH